MWNLKNCTTAVAGRNKGIGKVTVIELASLEAKVLLISRKEEDLKHLEKQLREKNLGLTGIKADVSISEDGNLLLESIKKMLKKLQQ